MKRIKFTLIIVLIVSLAFLQNVKASNNSVLFTATVTTTDYYVPGTTMDISFTLDYQTSDFEYGDFISLTFPTGITPNSSPTDPFAPVNEGQGTEDLNGVLGQVISWGSNNNDWGGIEIGQHVFIVNVTIDAGVTGDQVIDILVSGDEYGTPQGDVDITCTIQELLPGPDLSVAASPLAYTNYPLSQSSNLMLTAEVTNYAFGLSTETDLEVTCDLASYSETSAISIPLANGGSEILNLPELTPITEGVHEIVFNASALDDSYISNNSDTITIGVDSVYAHDDGSLAYSYGHTVFSYSVGTAFDIIADDDLTAVQFYLNNTSTIGDEFHLSVCPVSLYGFDETFICGDPVWESENLYVDASMQNSWTTVTAQNAVVLEVGQYALFINEHGSNSIEIGHDGNNTGDILMSVLGDNFYWEDETFGYAMLRLVLGEPQINTDINETDNNEEISIFPNPTSGIVNIKNTKNQKVDVYNMQGVKIIEINDASKIETIDLSKYTSGSYCIKVGSKIKVINLIEK